MEEGATRQDVGLGLESPRQLHDLRRFSHEAMATVFGVYAVHPDARYAAQAAQAAFELVDRLEGELSRFVPNSDVARINRLAAGERVRVSPTTMECLLIARHLYDLTAGAFDISIGTGLASLWFDPDECVVQSATRGVSIDLGGIGKGYAIDLVGDLLAEWGIERALVHGGFSSVLALAAPPGHEGWLLTLSDPSVPSRVLSRLSVCQAALAASGVQKGGHIVDPRTGNRVLGRAGAWVHLPRPDAGPRDAPAGEVPRVAAVADALTTAFMVLDATEIDRLCAMSPGLEAWVLPEPGSGSAERAPLLHLAGTSGATHSAQGLPPPGGE